jgi:hypothetical protein
MATNAAFHSLLKKNRPKVTEILNRKERKERKEHKDQKPIPNLQKK